MKVAYIYDVDNKGTVAGKTIAKGFQNSFIDQGHQFKFFNIDSFKKKSLIDQLKLCLYRPKIIFTSIENIRYLPLNLLAETKLVLWGQFFSFCNYEPQIHTISQETKKVVLKYRDKHDILVWSQHDEEINERFFLGYTKELGVKFIQLLHAADKLTYVEPLNVYDYDFIWAGNIGHRKDRYESWINSLKQKYTNYVEYNEHNMVDPGFIASENLYQKSLFAPNIHSTAQVEKEILLNERVFTSSIMGGFQICDNPLARKYFTEEELIIARTPEEVIDFSEYFKKNIEKRSEMISKMTIKILEYHTYHNRIDSVLSQFSL